MSRPTDPTRLSDGGSAAKAEQAARGIHEFLGALSLTEDEAWAAIYHAGMLWIARVSKDYDEFLRNCSTAGDVMVRYATANRKAFEAAIEAKNAKN